MSNEYPPPPPPPPGDDQGQGWGTPHPPPPNYGYPQGYAQQPPKTSPMAVTALVTGILGLVCCGCGVFSIAALVFGVLGKKEIAESNGAKTGAGMAQAGFILGIVGIVLSVLYWILIAVGTLDVNTYSDFS